MPGKGPGKGRYGTFLFPGPNNLSASVFTIAPNVNGHSGRKRCLTLEIISFDIEENKTADGASSSSAPRDPHALLFVRLSNPLRSASLASLLVSTASTTAATQEERKQKRESRRNYLRTSYQMHFPPTSNGMRSLLQRFYLLCSGRGTLSCL